MKMEFLWLKVKLYSRGGSIKGKLEMWPQHETPVPKEDKALPQEVCKWDSGLTGPILVPGAWNLWQGMVVVMTTFTPMGQNGGCGGFTIACNGIGSGRTNSWEFWKIRSINIWKDAPGPTGRGGTDNIIWGHRATTVFMRTNNHQFLKCCLILTINLNPT